MRIAFVSLLRVLPWGGSEELWFRTAKLALAEGHEVYSLTQQWEAIPGKIAELAKAGADTTFYQRANYSLLDRIKIKARLQKSVANVIPAVDADVYVMSSGTVLDCLAQADIVNAVTKTGKPYLIINQHNFENGNIPTLEQVEYVVRYFSGASKNFFVAERNLESAERQLACLIPNTQVVSNPINITTPAIKPFPASETLLMACVARFDCAFKGQDILLEALASSTWKNRAYHLKLYGSGPHLRHIEKLIGLYELRDKVTIVGQVSDIDQIWETNQVLVLPSLSEGTPLALVEAMLSGRAALATDVGDSGRYVISAKTGFLADVASVKCLTQCLEDLWNNKANLEGMGRDAFHHAVSITDIRPEETLLKFITE
ncbi:glycosyltransferase family 4 protein [Hymenobacter crusticola]|uniref:Glycosyl transferase family 1 domain-containing protein n=1 Tax=Hymenobacter crusticola TaxID=1770526 RepID=A0A243WCI9_9BACT|nr:glycosyltransferase family 4 protein [Hymenobacter crusticola]OUJ73156.1 hypothetical protein BXP70_15115 [Hymenobacter crusticola]